MEKTPKVFVSYSWTTPKHEEKVIQLANRLMSHGVEVILDKWDLKEGQDKYSFMEQSVTDPSVDRVLLICDKAYVEKANQRKGGVGDETIIITPEIYGKANQEKFIPIVVEVDEDCNAYLPIYVKSRIYIDLSTEDDRYESEYEKLLRNIHHKPLYKKPAIGKMPEWIENDKVDISLLKDVLKQIRGYTGDNKIKSSFLLKKFADLFIEALKNYSIEGEIDGKKVIACIEKMKPLRDFYIDYIEVMLTHDFDWADILSNFIESIYNGVMITDKNGYSDYEFEHYKYFIWEIFICTIATLYHYEKYVTIYELTNHTYFLKATYYKNSKTHPCSFSYFREHFDLIERDYKPKSEAPELYSLSADILIKREKQPVITKDSLSFADILLCHLAFIHRRSIPRPLGRFLVSFPP